MRKLAMLAFLLNLRPSRGRSSLPAWATSWRSPRSAACTIGARAASPDRRSHSSCSVRMARSVLSAIPRVVPPSARLLPRVRRCRTRPPHREKAVLRSADGDVAKNRCSSGDANLLHPRSRGISSTSLRPPRGLSSMRASPFNLWTVSSASCRPVPADSQIRARSSGGMPAPLSPTAT
jgi:hypothetical protein